MYARSVDCIKSFNKIAHWSSVNTVRAEDNSMASAARGFGGEPGIRMRIIE